jgi:O-antigen polymerase
MWDMNFGLLALAVYQNRPELAVNYIEWAPQVIKRKPRAGYYQFLVVAYKVIGDDVSAARIQEEAEFRFPDLDFNFDLDAFAGIENKNIENIQVNMIDE